MEFNILATEHTADFLENNGFNEVQRVYKISEPDRKPNIAELLYDHKIDFIINIPATVTVEKYLDMLNDEYQIRRKAVEMGIPVMTTIEAAISFVKTLQWLKSNAPTIVPLKNYLEEDTISEKN
jgi:carbamoyl-phosphate synthase large subunit